MSESKKKPSGLSDDDVMDLRMAAIRYKIDRKIKTSAAFVRIAKIEDKNNSIFRFLVGDTNYSRKIFALAQFLENEGYWPKQKAVHLTYSLIAEFIGKISAEAIDDERFRKMSGKYECYQWSSTEPGMITLSEINIESAERRDKFAFVVERQEKEGMKTEIYSGCFVYFDTTSIFFLKESQSKRPKIIICDNIDFSSGYISGLFIKIGSQKAIHISPIFMKKVPNEANVVPKVTFYDGLDTKVKSHLIEPITPFLLRLKHKNYRIKTEELMRTFIQKDEI